MVKVKFCGLKRPCDIAWANELHPDYVGFVFAGTKRRVSDELAAELRRELDPSIPAVGVFGIWIAIPIGWFLADAYGIGYYWRKMKNQ